MYWRIPSNLTVDIMKTHIDILAQALSNELSIKNALSSQHNEAGPANESEESSDDDYLEKLKKMRSKKTEMSNAEKTVESVPENDNLDLPSTSNDINHEDDNSQETASKILHKSTRKIIDSESESEPNNEGVSNDSKRYRSESDSDKDKPIKKKSRVIDSDED